jgi:O-antigen/teichoic acid export membrane protein
MALLLTKLCGESYVSLIVGLCSCALLFAVLLAREDIKEVNDWRVPNIDRLKEMLRYSAPLLLVFFLSQVIVVTDRFFLTMYAGPSAVGIYAAVFSLGKPVLDVIFTTINMSTFPALIKEYEAVENCQADDNSKLDKVFEVAIVKMAFFAIPAIFFISANAQQIVAVMLPSSYENGSSLVLTLVAIAALLIGAKNFIYDQVFHLVKKSIHQSYTLIPAAIVGIVLNIYLIPIYGVVGAAWASVISSGIALFTSKVISQKYFRVNIPLVQIKKILCGSILLYCVAVYTSAGSSLSELLISSLLSGGAYIVVCWCLGVLGFIRKNIT